MARVVVPGPRMYRRPGSILSTTWQAMASMAAASPGPLGALPAWTSLALKRDRQVAVQPGGNDALPDGFLIHVHHFGLAPVGHLALQSTAPPGHPRSPG